MITGNESLTELRDTANKARLIVSKLRHHMNCLREIEECQNSGIDYGTYVSLGTSDADLKINWDTLTNQLAAQIAVAECVAQRVRAVITATRAEILVDGIQGGLSYRDGAWLLFGSRLARHVHRDLLDEMCDRGELPNCPRCLAAAEDALAAVDADAADANQGS